MIFPGGGESVSVADVNGDGKMDLILGNIGREFLFATRFSRTCKTLGE
ncbi:MAG: FG-GAP repeat protein [Puia sp.]